MGAQLKASRRKTREARDYPLRLPYLCRQRPLNTYESSGRVKREAGHHVLWSVRTGIESGSGRWIPTWKSTGKPSCMRVLI
jgi:hypothetical protein